MIYWLQSAGQPDDAVPFMHRAARDHPSSAFCPLLSTQGVMPGTKAHMGQVSTLVSCERFIKRNANKLLFHRVVEVACLSVDGGISVAYHGMAEIKC